MSTEQTVAPSVSCDLARVTPPRYLLADEPSRQGADGLLAGLKPDLELFDALSIDVALVHLFVIDTVCLSKKESHFCGFRSFFALR